MKGRGFLLCFRVYVFTGLVCHPTSGASGGHSVSFYVFTRLFLFNTAGASGGSIFLLVKKDRGERHAKGLQSRPLETCFDTGEGRGDVRRAYEFAVMQLTRFRPVASSQTAHPSFSAKAEKLSRSVAPPSPTKPAGAGLWRGPLFLPSAFASFLQSTSRLQALLPPDSCLLRCRLHGTTYKFLTQRSRHEGAGISASATPG